MAKEKKLFWKHMRERGGAGLAISEFYKHGPSTGSFRAVLDQLTIWSRLKAKLAVYFFLGSSTLAFVPGEVQVEESGCLTLYGTGFFVVVDVRKCDLIQINVQDQRTEITLLDCFRGTVLQISDVPMNHAQVLERFVRGTA